MSRKIMVVAAHADDEALGCGGALIRHAGEGCEIGVLFLTNGVAARTDADQSQAQDRARAMGAALKTMGVRHHRLCDFPDNAIDSVPLLEITKAVESYCQEFGMPDRVYTHFSGDLNVDHRLAYQAVMTCFRPQPQANCKPTEILSFEVLSSTGWAGADPGNYFMPNFFVDISDQLEQKLDALKAYEEEMRRWPHARSIESVQHLARTRGATIGVAAAEAFVVQRIIE